MCQACSGCWEKRQGTKKGPGQARLRGLEAPGVPQTRQLSAHQLRTPFHTGKPQRHHAQPTSRVCTAQPRQRQALWKGFLSWTLFPTLRKVCLTCLFVCFLVCIQIAAAVKSLQSCPTLCDPTDSSPPGSSVPGILQARTLEWVVIFFSSIQIDPIRNVHFKNY